MNRRSLMGYRPGNNSEWDYDLAGAVLIHLWVQGKINVNLSDVTAEESKIFTQVSKYTEKECIDHFEGLVIDAMIQQEEDDEREFEF